ncbi:hypothetical protein F0562_030934 [Nyssa sinensis]|uniref:Uncharacterized protein n=1 Tax=Nyssa sinensis TaxID=561372 RepID=A0A5J5AV51_9ASTE|nr:hypothetical protein F0562_030934 [Nyssa sinensis]
MVIYDNDARRVSKNVAFVHQFELILTTHISDSDPLRSSACFLCSIRFRPELNLGDFKDRSVIVQRLCLINSVVNSPIKINFRKHVYGSVFQDVFWQSAESSSLKGENLASKATAIV